jgi:hypothetical protein
MRSNCQKHNLLALGKSEEHAITSIDTKTPHLFAFWFQLLSVERRVKGVCSEKFLLFLGFPFDAKWQ